QAHHMRCRIGADSYYRTRHRALSDLHSFPTRRSSDLMRIRAAEMMLGSSSQAHNNALSKYSLELSTISINWILFLFGSTIISRRSEEHTSELQSRENLVCRLLLEKKKTRRPDR